MPMPRSSALRDYTLRRLLLMLPTLLGITFLVFLLCQFVPGGPPGAAPEGHRCGRAGVSPRCIGAGPDSQSSGSIATRSGPDVSVYFPRLSVVEYLADRVAVMYLGRIVEIGSRASIFAAPAHPYTRALLESVPIADPRQRRDRVPVQGETPSAVNPPSGCAFHPRCPVAVDACRGQLPTLESVGTDGDNGHLTACIRRDEI